LQTGQAWSAFRKAAADLPRLYDASPEVIACDLHPDYLSTKYAARSGAPVHPVQHHWAHGLACMAENELEPPALVASWDGTGLGPDGTIWGGEFLLSADDSFRRVAHFRHFRLAGGEAAIKQPRRSALGVWFELRDAEAEPDRDLAPFHDLAENEFAVVRQMLAKGFNAPVTSSAGRLFDAVASLTGLRQRASFEGQAAMELEFAVEPGVDESYPFEVEPGEPHVVDWRPMIRQIVQEVRERRPVGLIAARFHNTLAKVVLRIAQTIKEERVVLTGGCFQNRYLTERCVECLLDGGFRPYWHQRVPPNDGGIAVGQVMAAARATTRRTGAAAAGLVA
jgi:hydrogenase maturation protein HypF